MQLSGHAAATWDKLVRGAGEVCTCPAKLMEPVHRPKPSYLSLAASPPRWTTSLYSPMVSKGVLLLHATNAMSLL